MHRIFVGTAVWTLLFFAAEFVLGLLSGPERLTVFHVHMLGGVFLATFVCVIHVMVMFHFIGSGKELKEAAEILGENADIYILVRRFKAQTFPYATFAPIVTGAAVVMGGGAHSGALPGWIHWVIGLAALALNAVAFPIEYRALRANLQLLQEVDLRIKQEITPAILDDENL